MAVKVEWWLLEVDRYGDIHGEEVEGGKRAALAALKRARPAAGCIATVEGRKVYGSEDEGVTDVLYRRTGKVVGEPVTKAQQSWLRVDEQWYAAGDESDYEG